MRFSLLLVVGVITLAAADGTNAPQRKPDDLQTLAAAAISTNAQTAKDAVQKLRAAGPQGLAAMWSVYGDRMLDERDPQCQAIRLALDIVAAQHDSHASRLFWYTDLDAAKRAAREQGKPILSLHLLGKLTDERSCANSRFFRSVLYANREVSSVLREDFILHWQSVRPVPQITIDFGDGRRIESTLTGNSIHYILDTEGEPIDALPGLYGPAAFLRGLSAARSAFMDVSQAGDGKGKRRDFHKRQIDAIDAAWLADSAQSGITRAGKPPRLNAVTGRFETRAKTDVVRDTRAGSPGTYKLSGGSVVTAAVAAGLTVGKSGGVVEQPLPPLEVGAGGTGVYNLSVGTVGTETYNKSGAATEGKIARVISEGSAQRSADSDAPMIGHPTATTAFLGTVTKTGGALEGTVVKEMSAGERPPAPESPVVVGDKTWQEIAKLHSADAELDDQSINLIRSHNPVSGRELASGATALDADALAELIRSFQVGMSIDTVRNEYALHRQIHEWLAEADDPSLEVLDKRIYAELFLTPDEDRWLGLLPTNTYRALKNNGVIDECTAASVKQ